MRPKYDKLKDLSGLKPDIYSLVTLIKKGDIPFQEYRP